MKNFTLLEALRFYFITDHAAPRYSALEQTKAAVAGGATIVQYRNKTFTPDDFEEVVEICRLCKSNSIPFIVNDDIILAKAVGANGVHVGQTDQAPKIARQILGPDAIIGVSVSTVDEFSKTDLSECDYMGSGPVYATGTKPDAKRVIGLAGLKTICNLSPIPVVAIGGIDPSNAKYCLETGAVGISVITTVSRSEDPFKSAAALANICGCPSSVDIQPVWSDEFLLIQKLLTHFQPSESDATDLIVAPGDDTALLKSLTKPLITTDAQREGIHFSLSWQTLEEIGEKAVEITLSDLAASYAKPAGFFVNLGLPPYVSDDQVDALYLGIKKRLQNHQCPMGGGNISAANQLSLDLFAVGEGFADIVPLRKNAKPGDGLYATGPLGMAKAGLSILLNRQPVTNSLLDKFKHPRARFDAAKVLADHHVSCVMDISDGLAGDAEHIATASHITISLEIQNTYLHPDLVAYCGSDLDLAMDMAVAGGEDYELLFTCPADVFKQVKKNLPEAYPVGHCLPFTGQYILNPPKAGGSFQHGRPR